MTRRAVCADREAITNRLPKGLSACLLTKLTEVHAFPALCLKPDQNSRDEIKGRQKRNWTRSDELFTSNGFFYQTLNDLGVSLVNAKQVIVLGLCLDQLFLVVLYGGCLSPHKAHRGLRGFPSISLKRCQFPRDEIQGRLLLSNSQRPGSFPRFSRKLTTCESNNHTHSAQRAAYLTQWASAKGTLVPKSCRIGPKLSRFELTVAS